MAEAAPPTPAGVHSSKWHSENNLRVECSPSLRRLRWRAWEPLETIRVLDGNGGVHLLFGGPDPHPIAAEPVTQPPVSSMDVRLDQLQWWEESWERLHEDHGEWDDEEAIGDFGARMVAPTRDEPEWGLVEIFAERRGLDEDDEDFTVPAIRRVHCCGLDRPPAPLNAPCVTLTGTAEGGVVTIGDWVTCVHAMLEQYHDDILQARGLWYDDYGEPDVRPDEILYVDQNASLWSIVFQGERDGDVSGWEGEQSQEVGGDRVTIRYVTI